MAFEHAAARCNHWIGGWLHAIDAVMSSDDRHSQTGGIRLDALRAKPGGLGSREPDRRPLACQRGRPKNVCVSIVSFRQVGQTRDVFCGRSQPPTLTV